MASGGEVGVAITDNTGSEDLEDVMCQPCQEDGEIHVREAVGVCTDCQEYLCQRCFDSHKIPKPMRGHQLLNKQEMMRSQIQLTKKDKCTVKCTNHGDKNVKYYCPTHGQLSCSVCLNLDHRVCDDIIYIPDIADDLENNKEYKQADDNLSSLLARFKKAKETAEQNSEALDSSYTVAINTIRIFRKEINAAIDKIEKEILKKAFEMKSIEMERMVRVDEGRLKAEQKIKATVEKLETFRKLEQNCNLFTEMMTMRTKLNALSDELKAIERGQSKTEIKFTPNTETLDLLRQYESLGNMTVTNIVKVEHSHDISVKCADDKYDCWITGSVILPDNKLLIVDNNNSKIKAIDIRHGQVGSQLTLSSRPWDIAVINNKQVAVTLPNEHKVDFVSTTEKLTVDRSLQLGEDCWGIDYICDQLAISFAETNQIKILDLQGTVLHSIQSVKQGMPLFRLPFYTRFGPDNTTLYVSNYHSHDIMLMKLNGTFIASYKDSDLACALGFNTIHQLTPDCKKIRVLLTEKDGLHKPFALSYSESENKLYVGMKDYNSVKVYKATLGATQ